jgi:hypothetical protein
LITNVVYCKSISPLIKREQIQEERNVRGRVRNTSKAQVWVADIWVTSSLGGRQLSSK